MAEGAAVLAIGIDACGGLKDAHAIRVVARARRAGEIVREVVREVLRRIGIDGVRSGARARADAT